MLKLMAKPAPRSHVNDAAEDEEGKTDAKTRPQSLKKLKALHVVSLEDDAPEVWMLQSQTVQLRLLA